MKPPIGQGNFSHPVCESQNQYQNQNQLWIRSLYRAASTLENQEVKLSIKYRPQGHIPHVLYNYLQSFQHVQKLRKSLRPWLKKAVSQALTSQNLLRGPYFLFKLGQRSPNTGLWLEKTRR